MHDYPDNDDTNSVISAPERKTSPGYTCYSGFVTSRFSGSTTADLTLLYEPLDLCRSDRQKVRDILTLIEKLHRPARRVSRHL
ncbi:hypothetical protein [Aquisalinus flavus]|uniref:Uncharacterized protein n=1 Tax=Aquisalinus flavus TaxID=1526572 RepID=A0A8J2Y7I0_9PROT|nr:hypothetical protein [Aquisalinus flavus]MBD0425577.1 hypothetical protein [Aquisalinus flavus]UNE48800.1 hypothetical protein FF099_12435 [Aquisalinus flavus]GGD14936.1 hypothetical protein GCM10011342_24660 [Aquisalinus flavus]